MHLDTNLKHPPHPVPFTQIILEVRVTSRCNEQWVLADYMFGSAKTDVNNRCDEGL